jgi:tRNA guanosine-2'-O-methyltransferase
MPERLPLVRSHLRQDYAQLPRHPLIVCASLIQNPSNLGGLCRTVEAFRLVQLVLADLAIARSPIFRSLAASSHHWQPLSSCAPEDLLPWLVAQQQQGYAAIALHADAGAIALPAFQFPSQSILVLGQELTGVPETIVAQCDYTVQIPQFGMVESLNVQVAGAIAIYEYMRQQSIHKSIHQESAFM